MTNETELKERFDQIRDFLEPLEPIWSREVLADYPNTLQDYPSEWLDALESLDEQQLWDFDSHRDYTALLDSSLWSTIARAKELVVLEKRQLHPVDLPNWASWKVSGKKQHEICQIVPFIHGKKSHYEISHGVDLGGGVGHLSRIMAHYEKIPFTSLDTNEQFQALGKERLKKYPLPEGAAPVNFVHHTLGSEQDKTFLQPLLAPGTFSVGLHTCGPLSLDHFRNFKSSESKAMLNFGCCYLKMNPAEHTNLSDHSKSNPLQLNKYALTLATRGHTEISWNDFQFKLRVKRFRYTLHFILQEHYGLHDFISVGESTTTVYKGSFADYAQLKLQGLSLESKLSKEQLQSYYDDQQVEKKFKRALLANLIRWQLGRALEVYLLLDRGIYMAEQGFKVTLEEFFDEKLSPRNIGLYFERTN
jgi:hypothetical protein